MPKLKIAQDLLDILYPVGSVYMSTSSTNPSSLFGGQWTQITGRFLYCANESRTTGGSNTTGSHVLTIDEIPSHNHNKATKWGTASYVYGYPDVWQYTGEVKNTGVDLRTGNTGGDQGHTHPQNLPPWFSVYCWYRSS